MELAENPDRVYLSQLDFIPDVYKQIIGEYIFEKFVMTTPFSLDTPPDPNVPHRDEDSFHLPLEVGFDRLGKAEEILLEIMGYEGNRTA